MRQGNGHLSKVSVISLVSSTLQDHKHQHLCLQAGVYKFHELYDKLIDTIELLTVFISVSSSTILTSTQLRCVISRNSLLSLMAGGITHCIPHTSISMAVSFRAGSRCGDPEKRVGNVKYRNDPKFSDR